MYKENLEFLLKRINLLSENSNIHPEKDENGKMFSSNGGFFIQKKETDETINYNIIYSQNENVVELFRPLEIDRTAYNVEKVDIESSVYLELYNMILMKILFGGKEDIERNNPSVSILCSYGLRWKEKCIQ